ncbi:thioredoxin-like domain-containing protein [Lacinutrix jangbogonensis]|uniref:thioredoxin-like domain-containing protein n=1 Tax=Lacinutrix jangbogonensis TaxID=1469557 RepID=UPI00053D3A37|nr:thioredoxin-like domain-containing protein [Lacinutrix jangbogonensis]
MFKDFKKVILTEFIKKKRSGIFYLSLVIGSFIPLFMFVIKLIAYDESDNQILGLAVNYYEELFKLLLLPFALFFFPLVIVISASRITQIDHKNKGWEFMETMPVSKLSIYFSKYFILLLSNALTILTFLLVTIISGWLFVIIHQPAAYINTELPFLFVTKIGLRLFIVGICISGFQYAFSVIIKSFIWPLVVGFFCLLLPLFLKEQGIVLNWYPYYFLNLIQEYPYGSDFGNLFTYSDWLSLIYAFLFLFVGYNWYNFKGFSNAFFNSKKNLFKGLGVVTLLVVFFVYVLKPNVLSSHSKTIITGTLESNIEINEAFLLESFTKDTVAKININNGVFKTIINKNLSLGDYVIFSDRGALASVTLGHNDSVNLNIKVFNRPSSFTVKGTRIAENIKPKGNRSFTAISYYLQNNSRIEDSQFFMKSIYKDWQKELSEMYLLRSVDNIVPREDFVALNRKKLSAKHLQRWYSYTKKRKVLFPNVPFEKTKHIMELENSISLTDNSLLTDTNYFNLVSQTLIEDDQRDLDDNTKFFDAIEKLPESQFKNSILFFQLKKVIEQVGNTKERDSLITRYANTINNEDYKALVVKRNEVLNKFSAGIYASNFLAYNIKNEDFNLSDYAGSYLLIDVWASWCGPCKQEAPYFESKASKYKGKSIKFVSISVDQDENAWKIAVKGKNSIVQKLRVKNIKGFGKDFNLSGIPRFILIDPLGKYVNSEFLRPSNNSFDVVLEQLEGLN